MLHAPKAHSPNSAVPTKSAASNQMSDQVDTALGHVPNIVTSLPGPSAKAYIERDEHHSSPSYTRDWPLVVDRALGSTIQDVDGNRFLDFAAGIAVCATGHCHPQVVAAIEQQARKLIHICGSDFYYPSMVAVMEKLASIVPGEGRKKVFLTNSGAEAIECGFKLARHATGRKYVIAFHGAFHGRTMGALSLTSSKARQREKFAPLVPMTAHVPYGDASAIESTLFRYQMAPDEVAAVFVESIQGEGGYIVPPASFLPDLRKLCDKHGILLVFDEVQSGVGRTGKWFGFEHFGVTADIVLMSKGIASGMPLGACIAPEKIMNWPEGAQGSTFGGNPVACAAAMATLELVESQFMANAARLGPILLKHLGDMSQRHACLGQPRGIGLMCGIDVIDPATKQGDPKRRKRIVDAAFQLGLIVLPCGAHTVRFCPPLCMTEAELELGLRLFDRAVAA